MFESDNTPLLTIVLAVADTAYNNAYLKISLNLKFRLSKVHNLLIRNPIAAPITKEIIFATESAMYCFKSIYTTKSVNTALPPPTQNLKICFNSNVSIILLNFTNTKPSPSHFNAWKEMFGIIICTTISYSSPFAIFFQSLSNNHMQTVPGLH